MRHALTHLAVMRVLAEGGSLGEVVPRLLAPIGGRADCPLAQLWTWDGAGEALSCQASWHDPSIAPDEFEHSAQVLRLPAGVDLPGRVLSSGRPAWFSDIDVNPQFGLASSAAKLGLRGAFGFPLRGRKNLMGAVMLFSPAPQPADSEALDAIAQLGEPIGQFIEQKRAEQALRESIARHRSLFLDSPISLWEEDFSEVKRYFERLRAAGVRDLRAHFRGHPEDVERCIRLVRVVDVNRAALELHEANSIADYAEGPVRGIPPESYPCLLEEFLALDAGQTVYEAETVGRTLRGRRLPLALKLSLAPGYEQTWSKVFVSLIDLTERRRTEQALRESEERFRSAFRYAPIGMMLTATDGRFLQVNQAFCDLLGYSEGELLATTFQGVTHPADMAASDEAVRQLLTGERQTVQFEKRYRHKRGYPVWVRLTASVVRDPAGQPLYFIAQVEDLGARRELEEKLRRAQKMEAVGRLAAGLAHDFNNLLTVIRGYAELMRRDTPLEGNHTPVAEIAAAAESATSLIHQLLAVAQQQVLRPQTIDLNAVLEKAQWMLRRVLGEAIELALIPDPALGRVEADPVQLEQILLNLAINAREAMPDGGLVVLETANVELEEEFARQHEGLRAGPHVLLTVTDTGPGMDAETRAHLFEPFFSTKHSGRASGLGLASVYGIVQQSGGGIWVVSERGRGSSFRIYFPRLAGSSVAEVRVPTTAALPGGSETVLVVEDDASVRRVTMAFLESLGYTVLAARDAAEATSVAAAYPAAIHLLLVDAVLPGGNGRELAQALSSQREEVKMLYVSGYTREALLADGTLSPNVALLEKPYNLETLALAVRLALS